METYHNELLTAGQIEDSFGYKYFYRQKIYRLADSNKIESYTFDDQILFLPSEVVGAVLKDLELKIAANYPDLDTGGLRIFYDIFNGHSITIDGIYGHGITINTDLVTEERLLERIGEVIEEGKYEQFLLQIDELDIPEEQVDSPEIVEATKLTLPEEIFWIRVDTGVIEGVEVKSFILVSLPSIAQFMGIRNDHFSNWIAKTTFHDFILSAHYKQIHATHIKVPWKRGIVSGYVPLLPFELIPEVIIAFRQSGRSVYFKEKAEILYDISKRTLEAVGIAISGDKIRAAEELAIISRGLGISEADEIIAMFRRCETRDHQVKTTKAFQAKVEEVGENFALITGTLTVGITRRTAGAWKAYGKIKGLQKSHTNSAREVMRQLSPGDGVGMTLGEGHFIKEPIVDEAIKTGIQGKEFYERLKSVGLLDDSPMAINSPKKDH